MSRVDPDLCVSEVGWVPLPFPSSLPLPFLNSPSLSQSNLLPFAALLATKHGFPMQLGLKECCSSLAGPGGA